MQRISIDLNGWNTTETIVRDFSYLDWNETNFHIDVDYSCGNYVDAVSYIVISAIRNELISLGKNVTVSFDTNQQCDTVDYAARINFFKHCGIDYNEAFERKNPVGRFIEITNLSPSDYAPPGQILELIQRNFQVNDVTMESISIIINELSCNIQMHSNSSCGGYFYAQLYPKRKMLEIIFCDCGKGVRESLSKVYPEISNENALIKCIENGVTSGEGRGQGLYVLSELVRRNGGDLDLVSGNGSISVQKGQTFVKTNREWKGVIVKMDLLLEGDLDVVGIFDNL